MHKIEIETKIRYECRRILMFKSTEKLNSQAKYLRLIPAIVTALLMLSILTACSSGEDEDVQLRYDPSGPDDVQLRYDPSGPDRDCGDFSTWKEANDFFIAAGGPDRDPHRLDGDSDGIPCESLR